MTTRATSREAYHYLVKHGLLKGQQQRCLDKLIRMGTATSRAVIESMDIDDVNAWRARFTELQGRGLIVEVGRVKCPRTRRSCIVWAPTDRTKPLDVARGHRINGKAWRELALDAIRLVSGSKAGLLKARARALGGKP